MAAGSCASRTADEHGERVGYRPSGSHLLPHLATGDKTVRAPAAGRPRPLSPNVRGRGGGPAARNHAEWRPVGIEGFVPHLRRIEHLAGDRGRADGPITRSGAIRGCYRDYSGAQRGPVSHAARAVHATCSRVGLIGALAGGPRASGPPVSHRGYATAAVAGASGRPSRVGRGSCSKRRAGRQRRYESQPGIRCWAVVGSPRAGR